MSFAILSTVLLPASPAPAQTTTPNAARNSAEQEAAEFARAVDAALAGKDKAALERLIADGFEFVHSTGRLEERASFVQRAVAGQLAVQRNPGETLSVRIAVFENTAVRTVRTAVQMDPADAKAPPTQIYTRYVYVKRGQSWQWVSAQSTIVTTAVAATIR